MSKVDAQTIKNYLRQKSFQSLEAMLVDMIMRLDELEEIGYDEQNKIPMTDERFYWTSTGDSIDVFD